MGNSETRTVRSVVEKIKSLTRSTSNLNFGAIPLRKTDSLEMKANTFTLNQIGWYPRYTLEEGLLKII